MKKKIGIIGAGVVGTAVGVVLKSKEYEFAGVYDIKSESAQLLADRIQSRAAAEPWEVSDSADILFITSNDSAIESVVKLLAEHKAFHKGEIVVHMSGAQSSQILDRATAFGAHVLSVHPMQSFADSKRAIANLPGSIFSIEGDPAAYDAAVCIVETMGGEYFFIDRKSKPLYHAGACVVSNYLVAIVDLGMKLLQISGISKEMAVRSLMPLISGTLDNIQSIGIPGALTGPIERGDRTTVAQHIECMEQMAPELVELYSVLGKYTTGIARAKESIDEATAADLRNLFGSEENLGIAIDKGGH